jgi:hypothetical protein
VREVQEGHSAVVTGERVDHPDDHDDSVSAVRADRVAVTDLVASVIVASSASSSSAASSAAAASSSSAAASAGRSRGGRRGRYRAPSRL